VVDLNGRGTGPAWALPRQARAVLLRATGKCGICPIQGYPGAEVRQFRVEAVGPNFSGIGESLLPDRCLVEERIVV